LAASFDGKIGFETAFEPELLGGMTTIRVQAESGRSLKCIPYYAWCQRGPNEMRVWFPTGTEEKTSKAGGP
jgi:hypothetical protein